MISAPHPPAPLLDEDARRAFIEDLTGNFCVSAGAGVGKTTAIVRRIANLALIRRREQPDLLSKLVVVTYGKLAAEELRVRTRDLILRQLDPGAIGRQTLLADLRSAFFGTIHSFCLKLIRDQGRFLGLPENVGLLEDRDNASLWERFCESDNFQAMPLPPALLDRVSRHLTFDQLLELARQLGPDETEPPPDFDPEAPPPPLNFSAALDDDGGRSKPKTRENQENLARWIEDFERGAAFVTLPAYKGGSKTFLEAVALAVQPYAHWLNAAAGALAAIIARAYRDHRLEKGLMTYRDQIYWCRRLVAEPPVLRRLRQRGYIVILDEAQDTDAEMFGILTEITRAVDAPTGHWPGDLSAPGPEPGRFCFVGDDQQAIYSERADLRVYRAYVDAYKAGSGGQHLEFSVTMRCPQRVVDAANAVFAGGRLPQTFVEFRLLNARPDCPEGAAWRLDPGALPGDDGKAGADERLAHECAAIADFLQARGLRGLGITHWAEVAVICPRVGWLEMAERIFAARDLPGCLLSQKKIARELARHSWPAALLHVLVHPWDRFELIGVLREIFAISDVDMARLHRFGDGEGGSGLRFWPAVPRERIRALTKLSSPPRLRHALELLHELRAAMPIHPPLAGTTPLAGLVASGGENVSTTLSRYVDLVFEKTALAARLETIGEPGEEAIRHLRMRALQAECEGSTLRAWVRTLVDALEEAAPMQAGAASAIQFLTSLKAKGLEWPVVIPLGLGRHMQARTETYPRVERFEGKVQVHFSNVTVDEERLHTREQRREEEFQRMFYVTLTRAQRLLIVPDSSGLYRQRSPNLLQLGRWGELDRDRLFDTVRAGGNEVPPPSPNSGEHRAPPRVFKDDARRLARAAAISCRIPQRILPSGLVHGGGDEKPAELFACGPDIAHPAADSDGDRLLSLETAGLIDQAGGEPLAGIGGVDYGNWWHGVLQRYPWKAARDEERQSYLDGERAKILDSVAWTSRAAEELALFRASAMHRDLMQRGKVFLPEMPFSYPREPELWIEGVMDLVIVTNSGGDLWIVDWKTDRRWASDASEDAFLDRLAAKYAPQLQAYAEVFSQGFKRPVGQLLLYSTVLGKTVQVKR